MIIVTGTKRSGTSLWMHVLVAAGLPFVGERFPGAWGELLREANPDGFFESELVAGINYNTNPHPLTGAYLSPRATRRHAVKVFAPGLVRTDVAFIDRCIATVRPWRDYVASTHRVRALQQAHELPTEPVTMPAVLEWWKGNHGLIRDLAIRGYPVHVLSYESLLRDPQRVIADVLRWIGEPDPGGWDDLVRAQMGRLELPGDAELAAGIDARHLAVFDALYDAIDREQPLDAKLVAALNETDTMLRPIMLEHHAKADAAAIADILGRQ
jgi:hypothetical protein